MVSFCLALLVVISYFKMTQNGLSIRGNLEEECISEIKALSVNHKKTRAVGNLLVYKSKAGVYCSSVCVGVCDI